MLACRAIFSFATIPNRNSPPAIRLREGYRKEGKVKTRTLANLSKLAGEAIAVLRQVLQGRQMVPVDEVFEIVEDGSPAHGHVEAVLTAMRSLNFTGFTVAPRQVKAFAPPPARVQCARTLLQHREERNSPMADLQSFEVADISSVIPISYQSFKIPISSKFLSVGDGRT